MQNLSDWENSFIEWSSSTLMEVIYNLISAVYTPCCINNMDYLCAGLSMVSCSYVTKLVVYEPCF